MSKEYYEYDNPLDAIHEQNKRIAELEEKNQYLTKRNEELNDALNILEKLRAKLTDNLDKSEKQNGKLQRALIQLHEAVDAHINRMMRQTIVKRTHGERNQDVRRWSQELLQILNIVSDGKSFDDIPY